MTSDLDRAKSISISLAKATVALSMLEDMAEAVERHENRTAANYADFHQRNHDANDAFVSAMLSSIRVARKTLDEIDQLPDDVYPDDDD